MTMIAREQVYEDGIVRIYWDGRAKYVELEGKGAAGITGAQVRASLERLLEVVKKKMSRKIMADTAKMDKIDVEDLLWMETDWLPRCLKAGVKYVAVVPPKSLGSHMALDKLTEKVDPGASGHVRRFFADAESARKWISQQGQGGLGVDGADNAK